MSKPMKKMIIAIVIVFGGLIVFNLIKQSATAYFFSHYHVPAVTVAAQKVKAITWHQHFSSVGTFVAENGVDVGAQSAGKVTAIHFTSGDYVEKDSPLIDIDDSVEQAQLKFYQANAVLQELNYKRQVDLIKRNATSVANVDQARSALLQSQASVENSQALINLKHIKAPFSGLLGIRKIDLGQYIQPGKTIIVPLQSMDPIYLEFYIPEQYHHYIKTGQKIRFTVEQNPGLEFHGTVYAIDSKIDSNTHNIQIQAIVQNCPSLNSKQFIQSTAMSSIIKLDQDKYAVTCHIPANPANKLTKYNFIPGMFAAIEIEQPIANQVIAIPSTAISYTMYGDSVFVVETHQNQAKKDVLIAKRVYVTTGDTQGNYTVITKGLALNQLVVVAGELKLQDGTEVVLDQNNVLVDHPNIDQLGE